MKKLFALSLAALMVMSLATVAFAADVKTATGSITAKVTAPATPSANAVSGLSEAGFGESSGVVTVPAAGSQGLATVAPGKVIYYPLVTNAAKAVAGAFDGTDVVTLSDAVKNVSISTKYTLGKDLVDSIKIVYKKFNYNDDAVVGYGYMLAITLKNSTSTASKDFAADITLKKSAAVDKTVPATSTATGLGFEGTYKIAFAVSFPEDKEAGKVADSYKIYNFKDLTDEQTLEFAKFEGVTFDVDVTGQDKMLIKADAKYDATVAGKYPAANINFFNGYGATFNKIGELHLPAEPGSYLYAINADGTLKAVKAEYDDGEEAFIIKTRTLGHYAISDTELEIAPVVEVPAEEPEAPVVETPETPKPNVNTGAAA